MKFFPQIRTTVELVAVKREVLSPKDYIELSRSKPTQIKHATYVTPRIGKPGFGAFEVEYHNPKLVPAE